MARIRSVSPSLRTSETAAQWDREARYAWVLLWGYLDDHGRGVNNAKVIAADCFPLDDDVSPQLMKQWLDMFEAAGSICRYEFEGKKYLHVLNWSDHQKPQHPSKVRIVPCEEHELGAYRKFLTDRAAEHAKVSGNPHEGFVSASPARGVEVSRAEVSEERRGGADSGAPAPPLYPDHCDAHSDIAKPGNCGNCKDAREAHHAQPTEYRHLQIVAKCYAHPTELAHSCRSCAADRKAAS